MHGTLQLSRSERILRIGAKLSKGVTLMLAGKAEEKRREGIKSVKTIATVPIGNGTQNGDETDSQILQYLRRVGSASPRDIERGLNLPKATAFRYLNRLVEAGGVVRSGKTTAIRYHILTPSPAPNVR